MPAKRYIVTGSVVSLLTVSVALLSCAHGLMTLTIPDGVPGSGAELSASIPHSEKKSSGNTWRISGSFISPFEILWPAFSHSYTLPPSIASSFADLLYIQIRSPPTMTGSLLT